jgi:predicted nucleotidyltransferase
MLNLYTVSTRNESTEGRFTAGERISILYHDLFDYPLSMADLIKWKAGENVLEINDDQTVTGKNGYFYLEEREGLIYKRLLRKRISVKKMKIAERVAKLIAFLPGVKMVGVTGSLAMENSPDESDIDLIVITGEGLLWTTRVLAYTVIRLAGIHTRTPNDKHQKDKLCLNIWLDESDLVWPKKDRNLYTAHEIAQIISIVNKDKTYEKFLYKNKWLLNFWPNSVKVNSKLGHTNPGRSALFAVFEKFAFWIQYRHMKVKITREVISPTRALFHPHDWGKVVLSRLKVQ